LQVHLRIEAKVWNTFYTPIRSVSAAAALIPSTTFTAMRRGIIDRITRVVVHGRLVAKK
jgi:hypothetical protein